MTSKFYRWMELRSQDVRPSSTCNWARHSWMSGCMLYNCIEIMHFASAYERMEFTCMVGGFFGNIWAMTFWKWLVITCSIRCWLQVINMIYKSLRTLAHMRTYRRIVVAFTFVVFVTAGLEYQYYKMRSSDVPNKRVVVYGESQNIQPCYGTSLKFRNLVMCWPCSHEFVKLYSWLNVTRGQMTILYSPRKSNYRPI
jgi:hypothetical protein